MSNEVDDWLYSIGLSELYPYFIEDGWTSLDRICLMKDRDINAVTAKRGCVAILKQEIRRLRDYLAADERNWYSSSQAHLNDEDLYNDDYYYNNENNARQSRSRRSASRSREMRSSSVPPPPRTFEEYANYVYAKHGMGKFGRGMSYIEQADVNIERVDRTRFRDHYNNNYIWVEKNHVNDVGSKYNGLSKRVDQKPCRWRCEDEVERGKEFKRLNDECADKILDNRNSIENSREWLVGNDTGVVQRIHNMSALHSKTRYDLNNIKRNMENIKAMRTRLLN